MVAGVLFIMIFGAEIGYYSLYLGKSLDKVNHEDEDEELIGHPVRFNDSVMIPIFDIEYREWDFKKWERNCIIYMALLCIGLFYNLYFCESKHNDQNNQYIVFYCLNIVLYFCF